MSTKYTKSDFELYITTNNSTYPYYGNYIDIKSFVSSFSINLPWNPTGTTKDTEGVTIQYHNATAVISNASTFAKMLGYNNAFIFAQLGNVIDVTRMVLKQYTFNLRLRIAGWTGSNGAFVTMVLVPTSATFDWKKDQLTIQLERDQFVNYNPNSTLHYHMLFDEINQQVSQNTNIRNDAVKNPNLQDVVWANLKTVSTRTIDIDFEEPMTTYLRPVTTGNDYTSNYNVKYSSVCESITINWNENVWGEITYKYRTDLNN